jgi:hypothetical protein
MIGDVALLLAEIGATQVALLGAVAVVAATVSGMSGVGGGLLLAIFIAPVVGVKAVVPTGGPGRGYRGRTPGLRSVPDAAHRS